MASRSLGAGDFFVLGRGSGGGMRTAMSVWRCHFRKHTARKGGSRITLVGFVEAMTAALGSGTGSPTDGSHERARAKTPTTSSLRGTTRA